MTERLDVKVRPPVRTVSGYGATVVGELEATSSACQTADSYAKNQADVNPVKVNDFIVPLLRQTDSHSVLDVGCGTGAMVTELRGHGFESYGVDVLGLERYWPRDQDSLRRLFLVDPIDMDLPFEDGAFDFVFTIGAIEHVGTHTGNTDRRADYHALRERWLLEVFRTVRPGGYLLIGGPNGGFPIDVAHSPDAQASRPERAISNWLGLTLHRTWGDNFLWRYADIDRYLHSVSYEVEALSVDRLLQFTRVPTPLRRLAQAYVHRMPKRLLATGLNPWVLALVRRT